MAVEVGKRSLFLRQQGEQAGQQQVLEYVGVIAGMEGVAVVHAGVLESGAQFNRPAPGIAACPFALLRPRLRFSTDSENPPCLYKNCLVANCP